MTPLPLDTPPRAASVARRCAAVAVTGALAAALIAGVAPAATAAPGDPGTISGQVFRDYNGNGAFDAVAVAGGPREMGLENVAVRVVDARGRVVGEATTAIGAVSDPGGAWSTRGTYEVDLADDVEPGAALRVEFDAAGYRDTFSGTPLDDNASVRFVTAPAAGTGITSLDYGVSTPEDYSTTAPPLVSAIQSAGDPARTATPTARGEAAVVSQYWNSYYTTNGGQSANGNGSAANAAGVGTSGAFPKRVTLATFGEVGAVWGTAYQNTERNVFAAATYKRLSGLGPLGIGGIYRIGVTDTTTDGQRTVQRDGAVDAWLDVQGLPVANVPGATVDLGPAETNAERGIGNPTSWVADAHAFANAGRIGIGSITVSADQAWLYFVNLWDRNVYRIDISDPDATAAAPRVERVTTGLTDDLQPWAVTEHHGRLYVGYVDTGSPWQSAAAHGSDASVVSATTDAIDAAAPTAAPIAWTTELTVDLGYQKGPSYNAGANTTIGQAPWLWRWNSWVDTWSNPAPAGQKGLGRDQPTGVGYNAGAASWNSVQTYPQAVLSDIEFSDTNDLVIGLMDRTSLQAGNRNRAADDVGTEVNGSGNRGYEAISSGDTLIAALDATGRYVLESDGRLVDGRVSARGSANEGIGGREFFSDTNKINGAASEYHRESTLGGIAAKTGYNGLVSAVIDPLDTFNVTGLKWLSADNGDALGGYQHTSQQTSAGSNSFQKAGGLGNVQALSEEAPLQIGDRVWFDANRNGIQDAGEPPLAGIVVTATRADGTGTPLTTTTDANGNYLFDSRDANPLELLTDYVISFELPPGVDPTDAVFAGDPAYGFITWGDLAITRQASGDGRALDSNPDETTGEFAYTTGAGGQNDHTLDAGWFADLAPTATIEKFDGDVSASGAVTRVGRDADTFDDAVVFEPGETRTVVIRLTNTGPEPLKNVVLTDDALSGADLEQLQWWLPGETAPRAATRDAGTGRWTLTWDETSDAATPGFSERTWAVGEQIIGEATLTVAASDDAPHRDTAGFTADGAISDNPVVGTDPYDAFTGDIQVIKYDGDADTTPQWRDATTGDWVRPDKAGFGAAAPGSDADTTDDAVQYLAGAANTVQYVVTNMGNTWLTDLSLDDVTGAGNPEVTGWTADLAPLTAPDGAPAGYPAEHPVDGGIDIEDFLFGPGQSFVVTGTLTLQPQEQHRNDITATATVVVPAETTDGLPTDQPRLDTDGPVRATDPDDADAPFEVSDDDPFHARAAAFYVQKLGADGAALPGSSFQLRADDTSSGASAPGDVVTVDVAEIADEPGRFLVTGLAAGTYWLEETRAPAAHTLLPRPVKIQVAADSTVTLPDAHALVSVSTTDTVSTVSVTDVPALGLPPTGDTGPAPYLIVGGALLVIAAAVLVLRRMRRSATD